MYNQKVQSVLLCLEEEDWRDYMKVLAGHGGLTIEARGKEWMVTQGPEVKTKIRIWAVWPKLDGIWEDKSNYSTPKFKFLL